MDFQKPLNDLEERVARIKTSVSTASHETSEQLERHFDKAQQSAEREVHHATQRAAEAAVETRSAWEQMRTNAATRAASFKAKAHAQRERHDAGVAAEDADIAEAEAEAAIDYAAWTVEAAELAILDALYLRGRAADKAAHVKVGA